MLYSQAPPHFDVNTQTVQSCSTNIKIGLVLGSETLCCYLYCTF